MAWIASLWRRSLPPAHPNRPQANGLAKSGPPYHPPPSSLHAAFDRLATERGITLDPYQWAAIEALELVDLGLRRDQVRSLYLYGPVGRGKSFLLDTFFQAATCTSKQRVHFHTFFAALHTAMHRFQSESDALDRALAELLGECRLLCFDEFHVHDIGDAMLLARLFKALFARGIALVVTTNYAPQGLLPNPLYHARFLPVIELIEQRMQVLEVAGATDYRTLPNGSAAQRFLAGRYVWPGDARQRSALGLPPAHAQVLQVNGRALNVDHADGHSVRFRFSTLCEGPTAVIDYLVLAERYHTWTLDGLDDLDACSLAAQQRFINLIDVLYDHDRVLLLIGTRPLEDCLNGGLPDLMRTRSRLGQLRVIGPEDHVALSASHH